MEPKTPQQRAEYLEQLQRETKKNQKAYQKKLIGDTVRRRYSELWLRKKSYKERTIAPAPEDAKAVERDITMIAPAFYTKAPRTAPKP
ncbi:hypothetical protein NEDG_00173 [Nematocida displodere]|uniref:Uncharacterized protein n=1 Tax=Nematocida displodere TaxID=1805483 RepID=A0A177EIJ1_9MICR|nr:hypothetical protein NEDG_00173 [Nematocida displodere]